jgi:hypothetical protein
VSGRIGSFPTGTWSVPTGQGSVATATGVCAPFPGQFLTDGASFTKGPSTVATACPIPACEWNPNDDGPLYWFSGDVGVTMNGANQVSNWADRTVHKWDVQPVTADGTLTGTAQWPVFTPNIVNGLPGLYFLADGGGFNSTLLQHLYPSGTTGLPSPDNAPVMVFAIVKFTTNNAGTVNVMRLTGDDLEFGMRRNVRWYNTNSPMSTAQDDNHILTVPPFTDYTGQSLMIDWQFFGPKQLGFDPQGATHINGTFLPIYNEAPAGAKGLGEYFGNAGFSIGYCNAAFGSGNSANAMTGYIVEVLAYLGTSQSRPTTYAQAQAYMLKRAGLA